MKALFVHDPRDISAPIPGGVQLCTQEYLGLVQAAADEVRLLPVAVTRASVWRLRRRLGLGSYLYYRPSEFRPALAEALATFSPSHIFFNRSELIRLAPVASALAPGAKIVIMSHGNQSGDDLYEAAGPGGRRKDGFSTLAAAWQIGLDLVTESRFRHRHIDAVCVMSAEEEILERWLGARSTVVLPRLIKPRPVDWRPVAGRVGFVGTLDHTPNRVALESLCARWAERAPTNAVLRLVGGPEGAARELVARHAFVQYLGRLDNDTLRAEAASWSLFLNPIFWLSRGASMKLGQSLAWGVPALSTQAGARGYRVASDDVFLTPDNPEAFLAALTELLKRPETLAARHDHLRRVPASWPSTELLACELKRCLS